MQKDLPIEVLISEADLQRGIDQLAKKISVQLKNEGADPLVVLCVLKGAFVFAADLIRRLSLSCEVDFVQLSSYGSSETSSGTVTCKKDWEVSMQGKRVLVIEDIVDTGFTCQYLRERLLAGGAADIYFASLLNKPSRRLVPVEVEFVAFEIEDQFVVGFGLDADEKYRELPFVGVVRE